MRHTNPTPYKTLDLLVFSLLIALISFPAAAVPFQGPLDYTIDILTGPFARSGAALAVVVSGYAAWVGRLSWGLAGRIVAGIVLIFGGATIADLFIGEVG